MTPFRRDGIGTICSVGGRGVVQCQRLQTVGTGWEGAASNGRGRKGGRRQPMVHGGVSSWKDLDWMVTQIMMRCGNRGGDAIDGAQQGERAGDTVMVKGKMGVVRERRRT